MFVKVKDNKIINMASIKMVELGTSVVTTKNDQNKYPVDIYFLDKTSETYWYDSSSEAQWVFNDITNFKR